jgi:hypothetical protein
MLISFIITYGVSMLETAGRCELQLVSATSRLFQSGPKDQRRNVRRQIVEMTKATPSVNYEPYSEACSPGVLPFAIRLH